MPAGTNGPEAERFFSALMARLGMAGPQQPYQGSAGGGYPAE